MIMYTIGQLIGCGALVALFILFMTEDERIARGCVGYLKATALVLTLGAVIALAPHGIK